MQVWDVNQCDFVVFFHEINELNVWRVYRSKVIAQHWHWQTLPRLLFSSFIGSGWKRSCCSFGNVLKR